MLEWLAALGTAEFAGFAFKEILVRLGQGAMEDYVKDFLKGLIGSTTALAKKRPVQEAVGQAMTGFLLLVQDELMEWGVTEVEIRDRYFEDAIAQFIRNSEVAAILGKALEKDCKEIDTAQLESIWKHSKVRRISFPAMPDEFKWSRIGDEYIRKVRKIVRETTDLREILDSERLEVIEQGIAELTRNTAQLRNVSPGFDIERYRASLQDCYGYLKLNTLDVTHQQYKLRLWKMFIEQSVREALPPSRYDLRKETQRKLVESPQLESELSTEDLERYNREYVQKIARPVLEVLEEPNNQLAVIVGDPGSGKSTLLQFLALKWTETPNDELPLLVELREYTQEHSSITSFLEYFHQGSRTICRLERLDVDNLLRQGQARVMFDGLDEVFDPSIRSKVITEIIRFTNEYPKVRVLATSRIVGYVGHPNSERLQNAGFHQFTLQDLNLDQIQKFIEQWHDLALGNDPDRPRLQTRLQSAIKNSVSIRELAGNPLLLTMMAILNYKRELPKDRAELYEQASQVLLYNWDVDYKSLELPADAIGQAEKQAMLRRIAYEMQSGETGLAGNLILGEKLQAILTGFLKSRGFEQPREKADLLIKQFRERNFILCFLGDDDYAFVHRTFLEYFCAKEFVDRLEKRRAIPDEQLTEDQLKTDVFSQHWREESWHEVLRLICGMTGEAVAAAMIDCLMEQRDKVDEFSHLFLAAECLSEVRNRSSIKLTDIKLLNRLKSLTNYEPIKQINVFRRFDGVKSQRFIKSRTESVALIAKAWRGDEETLAWLKRLTQSTHDESVRETAVQEIAKNWRDDSETLLWLKDRAQTDANGHMRSIAVEVLAEGWKDDPEVFAILKSWAQTDVSKYLRGVVVPALVERWKDDPEVFAILKDWVQTDAHENVRSIAVEVLAEGWKDNADVFAILKDRAQTDAHEDVRSVAVEGLAKGWKDDPEVFAILKDWAQTDAHEDVRRVAVRALTEGWKDDADVFAILKDWVQTDTHEEFANGYARSVVVRVLAEGWKGDPEVFAILKDRAQADASRYVRRAAVEVLAKGWKDDPEVFAILKDWAQADAHEDVRRAAIRALAEGWKDDPEIFELLYNCTLNAPSQEDREIWQDNPRRAALAAIVQYFLDYPQVSSLLSDRADNDPDEQVRAFARCVMENEFLYRFSD